MQVSCDNEKIGEEEEEEEEAEEEEEEEEEAAHHAFVAGTGCLSEHEAYSHRAVFAETGCVSGSSATVLSDEEEDSFSFDSSIHGASGTGGVSETESPRHAHSAEAGCVLGSPTPVLSEDDDDDDDDFSFGSSIDGGLLCA